MHIIGKKFNKILSENFQFLIWRQFGEVHWAQIVASALGGLGYSPLMV